VVHVYWFDLEIVVKDSDSIVQAVDDGHLLQNDVLPQVIRHLSSIKEGLLTTSSKAESDFMELGKRLQEGYGFVTALNREVIDVAELVGEDSDANTLHQVETLVNQSLAMLKKCRDDAISKSDSVKIVLGYFEQLDSKQSEIGGIAKYLRAVALNVFIETSRSEISDENFSVIAREIRHLSENIINVFKNIHALTVSSKDRFLSMYGEISGGIAKMTSLADLAEHSAGDSIEKTERLMAYSFSMVEKVEAMSRGIAREVEKIVVGVQFHDSMAQRIEHIVSGLSDVDSLCRRGEIASEDDCCSENFTTAHAIIALQCAQIDQVIHEIDEVYSQNRAAFEKITQDINLIGQNLLQIAASGTVTDNCRQQGADPLTLLSSELSNIQSLENRGADLENRLVVICEKAFETASTLSSLAAELHNISRESQTKALNAIIEANRLGGEGRSLSVLAKEMTSLSSDAEASIEGVDEIIASIVSAIQGVELEKTFESGCRSDSGGGRNSLDNILTTISQLYEQISGRIRGLLEVSARLTSSVSDARDGLKFFPMLSDDLKIQMNRLNDSKELLTPWIDEEASVHITEAYMAERYTMEKERTVHKESVAASSGSVGEKSDYSIFSESDDGVELFEDVSGDSSDSEDLGDNIELF